MCMKKLTLSIFVVMISISLIGQESEKTDVPTGFNLGLLPVVAFDADLGFQYGGLTNLYFYGDGSQFPDYRHSLYLEMSRYTKGSGINRIFYDSKYLIPNVRVTSDLSYLTEQAFGFYGFNGARSVYHPEWIDSEDPEYRTRMFYRHERKRFRFLLDFQGKLKNDKLLWIAGFTHYNDRIASVDIDNFNEGKDPEDLLPSVSTMPGLYERYLDWGLIQADEAKGGVDNYLKLGLVYDTRDNEPNPMSGMWAEAVLFTAPSFLGNDFPHTLLNVTFRQYFTLIEKDLSLAYRVALQSTIAGEAPFFMKPNLVTSFLRGANSEGLGGAKTIRGVILNRIVGDGVALGNIELRWKPIRFHFIGQNFYIGLNAFLDGGTVIQETSLDLSLVSDSDKDFYFTSEGDKLHFGYGAGLRIVMNENFIIAVDYGIAASKDDGTSGLYIGLNYLF